MKSLGVLLACMMVGLCLLGCNQTAEACDVGVAGFVQAHSAPVVQAFVAPQPVLQFVAPVTGSAAVGCVSSFQSHHAPQLAVQGFVAPLRVQGHSSLSFVQKNHAPQLALVAEHRPTLAIVSKGGLRLVDGNKTVATIRGPLGTKTIVQADGDVFRRGLSGRVRQVR